jgi:tetratricopeptide (TPR) repeat protein
MVAGQPLALDQAGAAIEEAICTLEAYIASYQEQQSRPSEQETQFPANASAIGQNIVTPAITTTVALAREQVRQISARLLALLKLCAFLHADRIPLSLFGETIAEDFLPGIADQIELQAAFAIFADLALVQLDTQQRLVSISPVVQQDLRDTMTEDEQERWLRRVVSLLSRAWPEPLLTHWTTCQEYLPHVHACVQWLVQWHIFDRAGIELCIRAASYLNLRAASSEAARLLLQALALCESQSEPEQALQAGLLHELGWSMHLQRRYTEAGQYYQQALAIREHLDQDDAGSVLTAQTLSKLGLLYVNQRRYQDARPLLDRALGMLADSDQSLLAEPLNGLAIMARHQDHYDLARAYYQRAQAIYESTTNLRGLATNLLNQATLFFAQQQYDQAEAPYRQALSIREEQLGPLHPDTASALSALATNLRQQGHFEESEALARRALDISLQTWGSRHIETARSALAVGLVLYRLQRYDEAEGYALQAQAFLDTRPFPDGAALVTSSRTLAVIYRAQQRRERAQAYYEYAIRVSQQVHGDTHRIMLSLQKQFEEFVREQQRATDTK